MTIRLVRPSSSISVRARMRIGPRPVRYASVIPARPKTSPPVGKSGPGIWAIRSSVVASGWSIRCTVALMTSPRLWVGMLVAIPTAMPWLPLTTRFGRRAGSTSGSVNSPE